VQPICQANRQAFINLVTLAMDQKAGDCFDPMNPCDACPIDDKIYECCGRNPETGDTARFPTTDNRPVYACPNLGANGNCGVYENRPYACQAHHCYHYAAMNSVEGGFQTLEARWKSWQGLN
jgi:Fe-S-cluster containining protein